MRPLNVLLVDDDDSIRNVLKVAFSVEDGIGEIREAADGLEALRTCRDFAPDLILIDSWMPGMDGRTAAGRMRRMFPDACIVAFSGVLDRKPDWADDFYVKGAFPSPEDLKQLAFS